MGGDDERSQKNGEQIIRAAVMMDGVLGVSTLDGDGGVGGGEEGEGGEQGAEVMWNTKGQYR